MDLMIWLLRQGRQGQGSTLLGKQLIQGKLADEHSRRLIMCYSRSDGMLAQALLLASLVNESSKTSINQQ